MPIGNIVADREDDNLHSIELSFNLHPNYWGCGYMKEACIIVMDYLFERDIVMLCVAIQKEILNLKN